MRHPLISLACVLAVGLSSGAATADAGRPNVLLIMADDLGFSDLGCYGGEIETPNLDRLARNGLRFSQFYNTARCWPSRAALLTGYYAQQVRRDAIPGIGDLKHGARGRRPPWARLLPELLKPHGYRSYHSGKWHIDGTPTENGFDRSYHLRDQGRHFNPNVHFEDDKKLPAIEPGSGFYGTTAIVDHALRCLEDHAADHSDRPFFHYLAFTAPHFPLQAPPEDIARYRHRYDSGWTAVRESRWERIQKEKTFSGGIALSNVELDIGPPYHFPEALKALGADEVNRPVAWNTLTEPQKRFQAAKMAIHAAMIDRMDREIGRVVSQLERMGALENTLIFFLSDNGASAEIMVRDDGHDPAAPAGSAATYLCLGPGWSTTCNTPFRRHKTWVHEGGTRTPLIAHWPAGIQGRGELRHSQGHVIDIVPTILELAGAAGPERPPAPGHSLLPAMKGSEVIERGPLWWAHEGNRAIRVGKWKLVAAKEAPWELYDLSKDAAETNDLAMAQPGKVEELALQWESMAKEIHEVASLEIAE